MLRRQGPGRYAAICAPNSRGATASPASPQARRAARRPESGARCYNRRRVASESVSVPPSASDVFPIDPVDRVYRELEAKIREYRPNDNLATLEKAFHFASQCHEG